MKITFEKYLLLLALLCVSGFAQSQPDPVKQKAYEYNTKAIRLSAAGNYDSSFIYYQKAALLYKSVQDTLNFTACQINIAKNHRDLAQYEKSLDKLMQAASILEQCCKGDRGRISYLTSCYTTMASLHREIGNYEKSKGYYYTILEQVKELEADKARVIEARTYNNLGNLYLNLKDNEKAKKYFVQASTLRATLNDQKGLALTLNNLGIVNTNLGNYAAAEKELLKALALKEALGNKKYIAATLNQLAHLATLKGQHKKASAYLTRSKNIIQNIGSLRLIVENQEFTVANLKASGQLYETIDAYALYVVLKDSLLDKEKTESLAEMQVRYETEKKQQEISLLEQEKKLQQAAIGLRQTWIISLITGLALVMIIAILLYSRFRREKSGKRKIQTLMQELQHRIKNNLQTLSSLLSLQTRSLSDETAIAALKSGESRINTMALIHQKLNSSQKYNVLNLREYTENIIEYLSQTYDQPKSIHQDIASVDLDVDTVIPLGLIINELVSNAFKHAFRDHQSPRLDIVLKIKDNKKLYLLVKDNGPGLPAGPEITKSDTLGVQIVQTLTQQLKGKVSRRTVAKGFEVTVEIPLN